MCLVEVSCIAMVVWHLRLDYKKRLRLLGGLDIQRGFYSDVAKRISYISNPHVLLVTRFCYQCVHDLLNAKRKCEED